MPEPVAPVNPAAPPRIWTVYGVTAALFVGMVLPGGEPGAPPDFYPTVRGFLGMAALSVGWIALVTLVVAALSPAPLAARLGLSRARLPRAGWGVAILGGLAVSQAVDLALRLSGAGRGAPLERMIEVLGQARGLGLVAAVLIVGVGAGTAEELFFRGYAQRRLVARHGAPLGITIAAALFALAHADPQHAAFAFCFGVFVGAVAHWSDSTWPAVAIHVVNNTISVLTVAGGLDGIEERVPRLLLALTCVALVAGAWASARCVRRLAAGWTLPSALG